MNSSRLDVLPPMRTWIVRMLAIPLLLGGMLGIGMTTIMVFGIFIKDSGIGMLTSTAFAVAFMALFAWSMHVSMLMFTGKPNAWRRAMVLYASQIPIVLNGRFHYEWYTGLQADALIKLIGHTANLRLGIRMGANSYLELLRAHGPPYLYGINLFALAATILLLRKQRERPQEAAQPDSPPTAI